MSSVLNILILFVIVLCILKKWSSLWNFFCLVKFSISLQGPGWKEIIESIKKGDSLLWFEKLHRRYGSRFCIWFGKNLAVFIADPEDVRFVLSSNKMLNKAESYDILEAWLQKGLLTSAGDEWHKQRKFMTPAFHFKILGEFKQQMEDMCNIMIEQLKKNANGEAIDIYPYVSLLSLDIICKTAMGIPINAQLQETSECREYVKCIKSLCEILHKQIFSLWRRIDFLFSFTDDFKKRQNAINYVYTKSRDVLEKRRKILQASNTFNLRNAENTEDCGVRKPLAFLDSLLLAQMDGVDLTDNEINVHVEHFLFAGRDTTSSAISFAIYLLSQHKDKKQKAYEEAIAMKGKEKEPMRYMEAVIKETLRLYPSVPLYSRKTTEDIKMRDLNIPKGTSIMISAYAMHRNAKYYPEPNRFDPERFLDEGNNRDPYTFIPFSAGPRNCIGQKYAMLELKVVLSVVLRNFELMPVKGFSPIPLAELILRSKNGIYVKLKKRCQVEKIHAY